MTAILIATIAFSSAVRFKLDDWKDPAFMFRVQTLGSERYAKESAERSRLSKEWSERSEEEFDAVSARIDARIRDAKATIARQNAAAEQRRQDAIEAKRKREIEVLEETYQARIRELEAKVRELEAKKRKP